MQLGKWAELRYLHPDDAERKVFAKVRTPSDAKELSLFSQKIIEWISPAQWVLVQFDNSSWLMSDQLAVFGAFLNEDSHPLREKTNTILFEIGSEAQLSLRQQVIISHFIFLISLFDSHAYLASPGAVNGRYLGVQDGFAYLLAKEGSDDDVKGFAKELANLKENPSWISKYIRSAFYRSNE